MKIQTNMNQSVKLAMKMINLVVVSGVVAEAIINVPTGPDCYKNVEKVCVDEA